jgi:hypothetical protein
VTSEGVPGSLGTGTRRLWLLNRQVMGVCRHFLYAYDIITKLLKGQSHIDTDSQSVHLSFEPLSGTHGHILAVKEYLCILCRGVFTLTGGRVCHVKGSQSLSVL